MKKNGKLLRQRVIWLVVSGMLLFLTGCGRSQISVMKEEKTQDAAVTEENTVVQEQKDTKEQREGGTEEEAGIEAVTEQPQRAAAIYVDVSGAVKNPGVYRLEAGSRVFQALEMAGGLTEEADSRCLNQAAVVADGQQIRVYTKDETEKMTAAGQDSYSAAGDVFSDGTAPEGAESQKVNINLAGKEELMTLTGIGESKAEQIIAYRTEHNGFGSIEELMEIEGIKEKTFHKLKDKITVN